MNVFAGQAIAGYADHVTALTVYSDARCTSLAPISDLNGIGFPKSQLPVSDAAGLPSFQSVLTVVYIKGVDSRIRAIYPSAHATAAAITGSKGGNAALTSLITGLAASGYIVDATT